MADSNPSRRARQEAGLVRLDWYVHQDDVQPLSDLRARLAARRAPRPGKAAAKRHPGSRQVFASGVDIDAVHKDRE